MSKVYSWISPVIGGIIGGIIGLIVVGGIIGLLEGSIGLKFIFSVSWLIIGIIAGRIFSKEEVPWLKTDAYSLILSCIIVSLIVNLPFIITSGISMHTLGSLFLLSFGFFMFAIILCGIASDLSNKKGIIFSSRRGNEIIGAIYGFIVGISILSVVTEIVGDPTTIIPKLIVSIFAVIGYMRTWEEEKHRQHKKLENIKQEILNKIDEVTKKED